MAVKLDGRSILAGDLNELLGLSRRCCFCARLIKEGTICRESGFFHEMDGIDRTDLTGTSQEGLAAHINWTLASWELIHSGAIDEDKVGELLSRTLDWHLEQPGLRGRFFLREAFAYSAVRGYRPLARSLLADALPVLWGDGRLLLDGAEAPMVATLLGEAWEEQMSRYRPRVAEVDRYWIHQWVPPGRDARMLPHLKAFDRGLETWWSANMRRTMEVVLGRLRRLEDAVASGDGNHLKLTPEERSLPRSTLTGFHLPGVLGLMAQVGESGRLEAFRYLMEEGGWGLAELDVFAGNCSPDRFQWVRAVERARRIGLPAQKPRRENLPNTLAESVHSGESGPDLLACESALLGPLLGLLPPSEALGALLTCWPWELNGSRMAPHLRLVARALGRSLRRMPGERVAVGRVLADWIDAGESVSDEMGCLERWHRRLAGTVVGVSP